MKKRGGGAQRTKTHDAQSSIGGGGGRGGGGALNQGVQGRVIGERSYAPPNLKHKVHTAPKEIKQTEKNQTSSEGWRWVATVRKFPTKGARKRLLKTNLRTEPTEGGGGATASQLIAVAKDKRNA